MSNKVFRRLIVSFDFVLPAPPQVINEKLYRCPRKQVTQSKVYSAVLYTSSYINKKNYIYDGVLEA